MCDCRVRKREDAYQGVANAIIRTHIVRIESTNAQHCRVKHTCLAVIPGHDGHWQATGRIGMHLSLFKLKGQITLMQNKKCLFIFLYYNSFFLFFKYKSNR